MLVRRKMGKIESSVKQLVAPIAAECDCTVVDVEYKKQPDGMHLFVFIDKKGGVTIDDCEKVHMAIDQPLDELDPTAGASYILNVSSPGLDRNLNTAEQLSLATGELVDIHTFSKINGQKEFVGATLNAFSEDEIQITHNKKAQTIPRKQISKITKHIEF